MLDAPDVVVTGPGGDVVPGLAAAELVADDVAVARFDPLREPGRYTVGYDFASVDGAPQKGAHQFTFTGDTDSDGDGDSDSDGGVELRRALAVLVGLVVAALAVRSVRAR